MSGETMTYFRIHCDGGCGSYVDGDTAVDARSDAEEDGWSFPHKLRVNGKPGSRTHDVCPDCADSFSPGLDQTAAKWAEMTERERRLRYMLRVNWQVLSEQEQERIENEIAALEDARENEAA